MKGRAYTLKLNLVKLLILRAAIYIIHCFYFIDARKILKKFATVEFHHHSWLG